jgi:hypothetical protein
MTSSLVVLDNRGLGFSPSVLDVADAVVDAIGATGSVGTAGTSTAASEAVVFKKSTVLTITALSVTMTDAGAAGSHGSAVIYTFPQGLIVVESCVTDLAITAGAGGLTDTSAIVGAVGSAATGTDNATLTTTEANIVPSTTATLTDGVGAMDGESTAVAYLDGTASAAVARLNFATPDAGSTANDTLEVTGTVTINWWLAGDN